MKNLASPRLFLAAVIVAGLTGFLSAAVPADQPFRVTVEPRFPYSLANDGVTSGTATYLIVVDNQGILRDHLLVSASHRLFGEAVGSVLPEWEYYPVEIDGERVNAKHRVTVNFEGGGTFVVGWDSPDRIIDSRLSAEARGLNDEEYQIAQLDQLDALPEPLQVAQPTLPAPDLVPPEGLRVVYHFFIDEEGRVRIPWLDEQKLQHVDDSILDATYDALMQWEFTPPKINGRPVIVRASQPFVFLGEAESLVDTD